MNGTSLGIFLSTISERSLFGALPLCQPGGRGSRLGEPGVFHEDLRSHRLSSAGQVGADHHRRGTLRRSRRRTGPATPASGTDAAAAAGVRPAPGSAALDRDLCPACGGRKMGAPGVKLDIDATVRADINLALGVNADLEALFD